MSDWQNHIIRGGLVKIAPDISTPVRALAYALFPPEEGTLHANAPFISKNQLYSGVFWPEELDDGAYTYLNPVDDAPAGDWEIGTEFFFILEASTGEFFKITATMVSLNVANTQGLNPLATGLFNLVLGTFNYVTYNLFKNNVGSWITTKIDRVAFADSNNTGNSGGGLGGFLRQQQENLSELAEKSESFIREKKAMQEKQLINWLGFGLLAIGLIRKSNTIALSGGVMLAYNAINKPKKKGDIVTSGGREMSVYRPEEL